ncbi:MULTISPECIES: maleylpyruvate isomerase family mycothiol-dependent enzyme [unclassified Amycolatopsis]|uniref:maleylpyruvate isomerase family mycothiol-dependent enzyme n=1 Tax=unclassified Amycolatopsis TaxID=2618356 RepID=UPI001C6A61F3|nr:maleylpyruvate isomerase family mycothiol-dependent enzyme [Amycolatopsis sp. DSM 110486]QYN18576.1 maleylpyruvate isomerase family mycothiol-dependent enzyme [Amycolatopsis sp. DSM 110486]
MTPAPDPRTWADAGTGLLLAGLDTLSDAELDEPCALPDWTRRHLLAHVASNAEALGRLLSWARTGVETPMYASPRERAATIESGAARPDLRRWVAASAAELAEAADAMPATAWAAEVVTAQGRTVAAGETSWMRARETCVHAVDLGTGTTFDDLPEGFLAVLVDDIAAWRSARPGPAILLTTPRTDHEITGDGTPVPVDLPLATAAAWLAGRHREAGLPTLPHWL